MGFQVQTPRDRLIALARTTSIIRPKDLEAIGVARAYLQRLCAEGVLTKQSRGIYVLSDFSPTELQTIAEVCVRVPQGIICLVSALEFHNLTTQIAHQVWLAIGNKAWCPRIKYPPIRVMRFSPAALSYGVEVRHERGAKVRVFSPAKTIADCFKFRNKVGLDVAIEALRDGLKQRKASIDAIWKAAQVCRVANVIRPYLEALI